NCRFPPPAPTSPSLRGGPSALPLSGKMISKTTGLSRFAKRLRVPLPATQLPKEHLMTHIAYRTVAVDGLELFYREAGDRQRPTLLLLHGFPTSSHMFRDLIPLVAEHFHVVAPDLPGFGLSARPARNEFTYTFDNLAQVIERFTEVVGLRSYSLYVFDYGAPVGYRLALAQPRRVTGIISQNGNAYEEGLS